MKTKIIALLIVLSTFVGLPAVQALEQTSDNVKVIDSMKMKHFESESSYTKEYMQMDVEFRPNVNTIINITIYKNSNVKDFNKVKSGKIGYAMAGFSHSGASYEHLILQIFSNNKNVSVIIVPDLPGHGNSDMSNGMLFGDLTLDDYANINKLILDRLTEGELQRNFKIDFAIFHSQACLVAMMTQEKVNLKDYGIKDIIFIAPASPQEVKWSFLSNLNPYTFLQYLEIDNNGAYFELPPRDWIGFFFTNPDGSISQNLPTIENVVRYSAKAPLTSTLQLVGINILSLNPPTLELNNSIRPSVSSGIFKTDSPKLWIIAYGNDTIVSKNDVTNTYNYLMDIKENKNKVETVKYCQHGGIIYVSNAVHDHHITMDIKDIDSIIHS